MKVLIAHGKRVVVRTISNHLRHRGLEPAPGYDGMRAMTYARRTNRGAMCLQGDLPKIENKLHTAKMSTSACGCPALRRVAAKLSL